MTSLSCGKNTKPLSEQIGEFSPGLVVTADETDALILAKRYPKLEVMYGESGLIAAAEDDSDILLNSLMGMRGLVPTYRANLGPVRISHWPIRRLWLQAESW